MSYGKSAGDDGPGYDAEKHGKLRGDRQQGGKEAKPQSTVESELFLKKPVQCIIYLNASPPNFDEFVTLVTWHGGEVRQKPPEQDSSVTHVISQSLNDEKVRAWMHKWERSGKAEGPATPVVVWAWLTESSAAGKLLPWKDYLIEPLRTAVRRLGSEVSDLFAQQERRRAPALAEAERLRAVAAEAKTRSAEESERLRVAKRKREVGRSPPRARSRRLRSVAPSRAHDLTLSPRPRVAAARSRSSGGPRRMTHST